MGTMCLVSVRFSSLRAISLSIVLGLVIVLVSCDHVNERVIGVDIEDKNSLELEKNVSSTGNDDESILVEEVEEPEVESSNKFSWAHHQEDHGIYAHRSLMSIEHIKRHQDVDEADYVYNMEDESKRHSKKLDDEPDPLKTVDFAEKEWQLMFRSFDLAADSISSSIIEKVGQQTDLFQEIVSRLRPECKRSILHIRDSVRKHKLWALRMADSNGKLPSGITYGKFSSPGDYEECIGVNVNERVYRNLSDRVGEYHKFRGKYCLIDFRLPLPERPHDKLLSIHEPVLDLSNTELIKAFPELKNYSAYASVFYEVGLMYAICLPNTCDVTDLTRSIGISLEGLHILVNNTVDCQEIPEVPEPLRTSQKVSLYLLVALFTNAALASFAYHYSTKNINKPSNQDEAIKLSQDSRNSSKLNQWIHNFAAKNRFYSDSFSIQKNFERLSKPDPRGLTFVHYTRIVAMALTVVTHTAGMGTLQAITKPADASNSEQIFRDFIPQMLANAFTSIQIFFFMAGFMLVISTYPSIKRDKGHLSFVEYSTKRAIRLMPGIAATICLNFLWPLVVDGPMLNYFIRMIVVPCEHTWWRTLAFLSNFDHVEKMCLRHSYFSASDYQLHLMAFPLLILLYKQPTVSLCIAGVLTVSGFVAQVIMVLTKTLLPFMMVDYIDKEAFFNVVHYIHHPVWNHISAFFYGFIIGYLVVKQIRINLSEKTKKIIWLTVLPAGVASIFAPYFWNHYKRPIYKWQMILYVLIDRFVLLTTCAWLSYATMVLARKPTQRPSGKIKQPNLNLPAIVDLKQEAAKSSDDATNRLSIPQDQHVNNLGLNPELCKDANQVAHLDQPQANIPRQRSSPNLQTFLERKETNIQKDTAPLNRTASSTNVFSQTGEEKTQEVVIKPIPEKSQQALKNRAPISSINTLCLILSRLTFQLYLFNMVVLWVDVNHSKYNWFFSYYFIITKACAVYICSSIMAMIFFVTLESPCLTLYIAWVKKRAADRARKGTGPRDRPAKNEEPMDGSRQQAKTVNVHPTQVKLNQSPTDGCKSSSDGSFEGLCMSSSDTRPQNPPTFRFIDLSSPPANDAISIHSSNQTKM